MLHHKLRIRREWKCPRCGRTVLTRGNTTSRQCTCADPAPFMQLVDTPRVPVFDPTEFATYTSPEYATPTEAELVEELPAHLIRPPVERSSEPPKPRRGKGYLRAEVSESEATYDDSNPPDAATLQEDDFGSGVDADFTDGIAVDSMESAAKPPVNRDQDEKKRSTADRSPAGNSATDGSADDQNDSGTETDGVGRRRKRRRRRGRRSGGSSESEAESPSASESQAADNAADSVVSGPDPSETGSDLSVASEETNRVPQSETTGRKRRRRRRDRRGKSE